MAPDKALGLCFPGGKRDVARVSKWESGAVFSLRVGQLLAMGRWNI